MLLASYPANTFTDRSEVSSKVRTVQFGSIQIYCCELQGFRASRIPFYQKVLNVLVLLY